MKNLCVIILVFTIAAIGMALASEQVKPDGWKTINPCFNDENRWYTIIMEDAE